MIFIAYITTKKLNRFSHTEIVGTILGMAKVVKHYCTNCKNNHSGSRKSYLSIFQDLIFDQNFNAQRFISIDGRHFSLDPLVAAHGGKIAE
jgi:hypothetical protein